jgi:hypothetical protein
VIVKPACKTGAIKILPIKSIRLAIKFIKMNTKTNVTAFPQLPFNCCKALFLSSEVFFIIKEDRK